MFKKLSLLLLLNLFFLQNVFSVELDVKEEENTEIKKEDPLPKNTLYIELKDGIVIAELFPKIAPRHVKRIKDLTKDGFYDGLKFHRVISGFMAQTGDPTGTGRGGSPYGKLVAEFNKEHHTRGTLSMARASSPDSANSQFFIVTGEYFSELDGQYTVFGRVIEGMEYVDNIKVGDTEKNGMVENPDIMVKVLTGDMLNNKSLEVIKNEIKITKEIQDEEAKNDKNYKRKSILKLLLLSKDVDSTNQELIEEKTEEKVEKENKDEIKAKEISTDKKDEVKVSDGNSQLDSKILDENGKVDNNKIQEMAKEYREKMEKETNEMIKKNLLDSGVDLDKELSELTPEDKALVEKVVKTKLK